MPGVTVLSPSPAIGLGITLPQKVAPMQNGASTPRPSVAEIKDAAKEQARKGSRGASAISLLKAARAQIHQGQEKEREGDGRGALSCYTKAAVLMQLFIDHAEVKQEMQGKMGVLVKDFFDFQKHEGHDLTTRVQKVEEKIAEESSPQVEVSEPNGEPAQRAGGSIADRMRALQSAGLSVQPSAKRISKDLSSSTDMPTLPLSPFKRTPAPSPLANLPSLATSFQSGAAAAASPHALVPTSSLGPPSPSSSTSSSPHASHFNLTEFASQFPSIDELEETDALKLPSVPTGSSRSSDRISNSDLRAAGQQQQPRTVFAAPKPFPVLPLDPGPRPSSTPIPQTIDTFMSRPGTPSPSPASPRSVPRKPSGLSLGGRSPVLPQSTGLAADKIEKADTPLSALFPRTLMELRSKPNYKVLVLDVRTRSEFEREHIRLDAVVCLEPSVLRRDGINARAIEDSLSVAPRHEWTLFSNRDKFDLVAICDDSSETLGLPNSPLSILSRQIYEVAFIKFLKHPPMLLVGGLQAWKREFGELEVIKGGSPALPSTNGGPPVPVLPNGNAFVSMPVANGITNGTVLNGSPNGVSTGMSSTSGHVRLPAETFTSSVPPTSASDLVTLSAGRQRSGTVPSPAQDHFGNRPWIPPPSTQESAPASPRLQRRPAITRPQSSSVSFSYTPAIPEHSTPPYTPPLTNGATPIQYPQFPRHISPQVSGSSFSSPGLNGLVSMPPQASINPSPLSRRRSDYVDQSQEALSGLTKRPPIDYPDLSSHNIIRPPPAVAPSISERQDNRPRIVPQYALPTGPKPPTIPSDYPVTYWPDIQIGTSGLKNLGNTCYMNSTMQCLSATVPFARFFTDGRWKSAVNMVNPLGTKGNLAHAFANILRDMWQAESQILSPVTFRRSVCMYASQFSGSEQHDSQEFLSFFLDGLHEDLNRVLNKPQLESTPEREAELERLPVQIASEQEWQIYRMRNDSLVVDFFQGQFRNKMECLTCHKTSTTYNAFMYLSLPIPTTRVGKVTLQQCLEAFVKEEVMEKSDAWHCPHCKELRKATKRLSLSRLPPVLLIHLKRFSVKGPFTDKVDTFVDFPTKSLDLTNYMPPPLPPGVSGGSSASHDDPRSQMPPYRYDLYGVTNHFGTLSTGHYTAFIASRGGWLYCDDSRVTQADPKDVVGKPAYILFYKRVKA